MRFRIGPSATKTHRVCRTGKVIEITLRKKKKRFVAPKTQACPTFHVPFFGRPQRTLLFCRRCQQPKTPAKSVGVRDQREMPQANALFVWSNVFFFFSSLYVQVWTRRKNPRKSDGEEKKSTPSFLLLWETVKKRGGARVPSSATPNDRNAVSFTTAFFDPGAERALSRGPTVCLPDDPTEFFKKKQSVWAGTDQASFFFFCPEMPSQCRFAVVVFCGGRQNVGDRLSLEYAAPL